MLTLIFIDNIVFKGSCMKMIKNAFTMAYPFAAIWLFILYIGFGFLILNFGKRTRLIIGAEIAIAASIFFEKYYPQYTALIFTIFASAMMILENFSNVRCREFSVKDFFLGFLNYINDIKKKLNKAVSYIEKKSGLKYPLSIFPVFAVIATTSMFFDIIRTSIVSLFIK